ncbi:hypothetical protein LTR66_004582 [Elasticomyces elasticus]|nr:hypothetical protein LTR66_004582 [Elasticomyces elasticus]
MSRTIDATTGEDSSTTPSSLLSPPSPPPPPSASTLFNESRFASRGIDVEAQGIIRAVEPLAGEILWYEFEYPEPEAPTHPPPPPRHYGWRLAWQAMQDGWPHLLGCGVIVGAIFWAFKESARRANMKG